MAATDKLLLLCNTTISNLYLPLFLEYFLFDISDIALLLNKLYQFAVAHSPGKGNLPYLPGYRLQNNV